MGQCLTEERIAVEVKGTAIITIPLFIKDRFGGGIKPMDRRPDTGGPYGLSSLGPGKLLVSPERVVNRTASQDVRPFLRRRPKRC